MSLIFKAMFSKESTIGRKIFKIYTKHISTTELLLSTNYSFCQGSSILVLIYTPLVLFIYINIKK